MGKLEKDDRVVTLFRDEGWDTFGDGKAIWLTAKEALDVARTVAEGLSIEFREDEPAPKETIDALEEALVIFGTYRFAR